MIDSIYGMTPINKTAASVVGQSGCNDVMTDEQIRDNLVAKKKSLEIVLKSLKKGSKERKSIGQEIQDLNKKISDIRPKKKCKGLENHFIDVARETLSDFEFKRWISIASKRTDEEKGKTP